MRQFVEGFNQQVLVQLGLDPSDALILQWFKSFSLSDKQKYLDRGADRYYWVKYSKVISDLPCLYITNPKKIGKIFARLSGEGMTNQSSCPLKKIRANVNGRQELYFKFNPDVLEMLEGKNMSDGAFDLGVCLKKADKNKRDHKLNPNVMEILRSLKEIKLEDGRDLFSFQLPIDEYHYTKSIARFEKQMLSLQGGMFRREYRIAPMFEERNSYYITEKNRKKLKECEGHWTYLMNMMDEAAQRYARWFLPYNEPQKKEWLTRDISSWVYNEHGQQSIFYLCLVNDPSPIREVNAEKLYDKIPATIRDIAEEKLYEPKWDGYDFWNRIRSVVQWYQDNAEYLRNKEANSIYWLDGGLYQWFDRYCEWMVDVFGGTVHLNNIGTKCPTWGLFVRSAKEEFDIGPHLTEEM